MTKPFALIVEDDDKLADIFSIAMGAAGFEIEIVYDGRAALARLAGLVPDVLVLDLHLPYVSGRDILRQVRADSRLAQTRVILATADAMAAEVLRDEADLVLLKPISPIQLRELATRLHSAGMQLL